MVITDVGGATRRVERQWVLEGGRRGSARRSLLGERVSSLGTAEVGRAEGLRGRVGDGRIDPPLVARVIDYVNLGILVGTEDRGDPAGLAGVELPVAPSNLRAVIDQDFATDALEAVIESGELADFFNRVIKRHSQGLSIVPIEVHRGSVTFDQDSMRVVLDCTAVDACTGGKDLGFAASVSGTFELVDGELTFQSSHVDFDLDNSDAVICLLLSALTGPFGIVVTTAVLAFVAAYNPDGKDISTPTAFATLLPGSESDAAVRVDRVSLRPGVMVVDGTAEVVANRERIFTYLRVVEGWPIAAPLAGATVELIELDSPAPPGDDVVIPEAIERTQLNDKFEFTEVGVYTPMTDHQLGSAVTDDEGFVAFASVVRSVGGTFSYTKTIEEIHTGRVVSNVTTRTLVPEPRPDLGVTITAADGRVLATRLPVALNVADKRLGTRERPVQVRVSGGQVTQ